MSLIFDEGWLERNINFCLRQVYEAHGPLTPRFFPSFSKRLAGLVRGRLKEEALLESHEPCGEIIKDLKRQVDALKAEKATFTGQLQYWMRKANQ